MSTGILKGGEFVNRYVIEGVLTTKSPFHLGNGTTLPPNRVTKKNAEGKEESVDVTEVDVDFNGKPRIPGSSLRGALRSYLLGVFESISRELAFEDKYEKLIKDIPKQEDQIIHARTKFSHLERLFGTPFAESKIEVRDASCSTSPAAPMLGDGRHAPYWDGTRLTYVETGVAIDPKTRTALDEKLYHFEAVPPGVSFRLAISGQNLSDLELGMLLFGLDGFNSEIWPLTLGSMSGAGFGRFEFKRGKIRLLKASDLKEWVKKAVDSPKAGYDAIEPLPKEDADALVESFKRVLKEALEGGGK